MPNAAFTLLVALAGSLAIAAPSSTLRLLILGGQNGHPDPRAIDIRCLFVPNESDLLVHLLSYGLLIATLAGGFLGLYSFFSEWRRTDRFIRRSLDRRLVGEGTLDRLTRRAGLADRVDLVRSDVPRCFSFGLRRPRVCVTTGLLATLGDAELEAVLRHEAYHARNRDPLRLMVGRALTSTFFFVPALRDLFAHYRLHVELLADQEAVREMREALSLASALDKLLDARVTELDTVPGAAHGNGLELRIDNLLGERAEASFRAPMPRIALSLALLLLVAAPALAPIVAVERELLAVLGWAPHPSC